MWPARRPATLKSGSNAGKRHVESGQCWEGSMSAGWRRTLRTSVEGAEGLGTAAAGSWMIGVGNWLHGSIMHQSPYDRDEARPLTRPPVGSTHSGCANQALTKCQCTLTGRN